MANAIKNIDNAVTSDVTNVTNLRMTNAKLAEQLRVELALNKVIIDLLRKMYMWCHSNSVRNLECK